MTKNHKPLKVVIIAAGTGSRIVEMTNDTPKTLLPFGKGTILSAIINNFSKTGVNEFVIVVGYKAAIIKEYLSKKNNFGHKIAFVDNKDWHKGNGISVLLAEKEIKDESFILTMSDHIVSESAVNKLIVSENDSNLLLVDRNVNDVFDIDDATKVELKEDRIINIGKEIAVYNGIDCGVFRLTGSFFDAMRQQLAKGRESISAAIEILISNKDMHAVFTAAEDYWLDIDTPQAYKHGLENLADK